MLKSITRTRNDLSLLLLRLTLGIVFFFHGAQKALGWFGGYGFSATMTAFSEHMHIPYVLTLLVIAAEFLGSIGLILGLFSRIAALGIACVMAGAIFMLHARNGFFMNWSGTQKGEGFEYHLLVIAIALALALKGGGAFSIDRRIAER